MKQISTMALLLLMIAYQVAGSDSPLRLNMPVGMFNVYAASDGNLGRSEPDLLEVFVGSPELPYECINIVQHYWPSLDVPSGATGDPYLEWWKAYIQEAYNLTNQDGEVRLQVIVGPLYEAYLRHGEKWFLNFIGGLCDFEKNSPLDGSIAGWYVVEEPMSSAHNFSPSTVNWLIDLIRQVESERGVRRHKIYIDVGIEGKYYSPQKLVDFCRNVDVVMVSASTYLWLDPREQPVWEPHWWAIHWSMMQARSALSPVFEAQGRPMPEIHAVLQVYDAMGHGQPTNWEIRQQIDYALNYGRAYENLTLVANDPPADGIWFFWWTGIAKKPTPDSNDWTYGRRIAEAIESQISGCDTPGLPDDSAFLLNDGDRFNPSDRPIPYQLARKGRVEIDVIDHDLGITDHFDMGIQVAGLLRDFGGPRWEISSGRREGKHIIRLIIDGIVEDEKTVDFQWNTRISSATQVGRWLTDGNVELTLIPPPIKSGIAGYSHLFDHSPKAVPPTAVSLSNSVVNLSQELRDGIWYFLVRHVDGEGIWSGISKFGPIMVDSTPPAIRLANVSPAIGEWSAEDEIRVEWEISDETSGLAEVEVFAVDDSGTRWLSAVSVMENSCLFQPADGVWFLRYSAVDLAGNSTPEHVLGPFRIDRSPPSPPMISSSTHVAGVWSNDRSGVFLLSSDDSGSGMTSIKYSLQKSTGETITSGEIPDDGTVEFPHMPDGMLYLTAESVDLAGNVSEGHRFGPIMIDTTPPAKPVLTSDTHQQGQWSLNPELSLRWNDITDSGSGGVSFESVITQGTPDWSKATRTDTSAIDVRLQEGMWRICVRSIDALGNASMPDVFEVLIDLTPPREPELAAPPDDRWLSGSTVLISWNADDISGIINYSYSLDNGGMVILDGDQTAVKLHDLPDGVHIFRLVATNGVGLSSRQSECKFKIDNGIPSLSDLEVDVRADRAVCRWEAVPPVSGIAGYSALVDSDPTTEPPDSITTYQQRMELSNLPDGRYYCHVKAVSGSGKWSQAIHDEFLIDTTVPEISIDTIGEGWRAKPPDSISGRVTDELSGIDPDSFEFQINGGSWFKFEPENFVDGFWTERDEIVPFFRDGRNVLRIRAKDVRGNTGISDESVFDLDTAAPVVHVSSPTHPDETHWYRDRDVRITIAYVEAGSGIVGFSVTIDRQQDTVPPRIVTHNPGTDELTILVPNDGVWFIHVSALDEAGNWSDPDHLRVNIDSVNPEARISLLIPEISDDGVTYVPARQNVINPTATPVKIEINLSEQLPEQPILAFVGSSGTTQIELGNEVGLKIVMDLPRNSVPADGFYRLKIVGNDIAGNEVETIGIPEIEVHSEIDGEEGGQVFADDLSAVLEIPHGAFGGESVVCLSRDADGWIASFEDVRLNSPVCLKIRCSRDNSSRIFFDDGVRKHPLVTMHSGVWATAEIICSGKYTMDSTIEKQPKVWAAPNPFSDQPTRFYLVGFSERVIIRVFKIDGTLVRKLVLPPFVWDGKADDGTTVESGVYLFQASDGRNIASGTVVLVR